MLCERKKPYLSIGGTFSSFSTSDINDDNRSDGVTFYQEFLKEGLFQSAEIVHTLIREEENGKPIKPFAVYAISVYTRDIDYTIERRYSCFHQVYKKLSKRTTLKTEFPTKTFLTPSTNQSVVSRRKTELNKFIQEVVASNDPDMMVEFFEFLDLKQVYSKERILLPYQKQADKRMDEQVVLELLVRLGSSQDNVIGVLNDLERELFDNKLRITNEVIRQLFVGLGKRKGLLEVSLGEQTRELDCFRGLQLIMRFLNFEQNREAEIYIRNFVVCPVKNLKIHPTLMGSSKIKLDYFRLLEIYFKRNCDINMESTMQFLFAQSPEERKEFENWSKLREKSSLNVEPYEDVRDMVEINESQIDEKVRWLKAIMREDKQHWTEVATFNKPGTYNLHIQVSTEGVNRYTFDSNRPEEELRSYFLESMKWHRWTIVSRTDPYARSLTAQVQLTTCRKFQFCCSSENFDHSPMVIRKPPARRPSAEFESFYEVTQLDPAPKTLKWRVRVLRYFDSSSCQEYFRSQLQLGTEPLAEALLQ